MFSLLPARKIAREAASSPGLIETLDITCQTCHLRPGVLACLGTRGEGLAKRTGGVTERALGGGGADLAAQRALPPG